MIHKRDKKAYGQKMAASSNRIIEVQEDPLRDCFNNALEASRRRGYHNHAAAVDCALNFRLSPMQLSSCQDTFHREFELLSQPSLLEIGVQICTRLYSDAAFLGKDKAMQDLLFWDPWFGRAYQIQVNNIMGDRAVVW